MNRQPKPGIENPCQLCLGHGWMQLTHDPDVDIDCPACDGTGRRNEAP